MSAVAYATVNALLRDVAPTIDPYAGSLLRQLPLLCITTVCVLATRPVVLRPRHVEFLGRRAVIALLAAGTVSFVIGNVLFFRGLAWVGLAVSAAAAQGGIVVGGALLSAFALREPPTRGQIVGTIVVIVGLALTATAGTLAAPVEGRSVAYAVLGFLAAAVAGACYTTANAVSRHVQRRRPAFLATLALVNLGGVVALVVVCLVRNGFSPADLLAGIDRHAFTIVVLAGLVNVVAIASVTLAVRYTNVVSVSTISALVIVLSTVVAVAVFDERLSPLLVIGTLAIVAGIAAGVRPGASSLRPTRQESP